MSITITRAVWECPHVAGNQLLVMLALADFADDDGRCWPSIAAVAERARLSSRHVHRVIAALVEAGLLRAVRRGQHRTNVWLIDPGSLSRPAPPGTASGAPGVTTVSPLDQPGVTPASPLAQPGVTPASPLEGVPGVTSGAPGVTPASSRGDSCVIQNHQEPSREPSSQRARAPLGPGAGGHRRDLTRQTRDHRPPVPEPPPPDGARDLLAAVAAATGHRLQPTGPLLAAAAAITSSGAAAGQVLAWWDCSGHHPALAGPGVLAQWLTGPAVSEAARLDRERRERRARIAAQLAARHDHAPPSAPPPRRPAGMAIRDWLASLAGAPTVPHLALVGA